MSTTDEVRTERRIRLDARSAVPLHHQLQKGLQREIERGALAPGEQLPTVQALAREHNVSPQTVMRAYMELARLGLVQARRGSGTFVAEQRTATTEVLLPGWCGESRGMLPEALFHQLLEGLQAGLGEPARRFSFTHIEGTPPSGREIVDVCLARRADGVIAYGQEWVGSGVLEQAAGSIATVALLPHGARPGVDTVDVDVAAAVRALIERRLRAGQRTFAFVGLRGLLEREWGRTGYGLMLDEFEAVVREGGLSPTIAVVEEQRLTDAEPGMLRAACAIPSGATVLAATPSVMALIDPQGDRFDGIAYTDNRVTRKAHEGRTSLLYLALEEAAQAAARLLAVRMQVGLEAPPRLVTVRPVILDAQGDGQT